MRSDVPIKPRADIQRICRDCSTSFTLTVGEQEFFRDRNLPNRWRDRPHIRLLRPAYLVGVAGRDFG